MTRITLPTPGVEQKPKRRKKKPKTPTRTNDCRSLPHEVLEADEPQVANRLPIGKPLGAPNTVAQAYRARRLLIQQRRMSIGPVQALSPHVQRLAEEALHDTAEFCLPLGTDPCLEVHQVPFSEDDIRGFEMAARRAGYAGKKVLRYVPNGIWWRLLEKLPVPVRLPWNDDDIPKLATLAPNDDDLGVLNGYWYLHVPRAPFMSAGRTYGEQAGALVELAYLYHARESLITLCDLADMAFLLALAAWCGDLENEPVSIVRTQTEAGRGSHACVLFGPSQVEITKCEDDFRAPYLGIAPAVV